MPSRANTRSQLADALERCAKTCKDTVALYLDPTEATESEFGQTLLAATAALRTAAAHEASSAPKRRAALELTRSLCQTAAATCRKHGLDEPLLRAAVACERAAALCQEALRRPDR
jgi:hypothetical protein